ncbi:MAG: cell division protein ZapD [Methylophagaceae bacterium]
MPEKIIYEQPLNERIRTFLRLEFLFARVDHALQHNDELNNRNAIDGLLNLLSVFERSDLKQEIIKELERLVSTLSALENTPGVDKRALDNLLNELDQTLDSLHLNKTAIGQTLRENDFLYSIRQRASIPGGSCDFDLPAYHFWLRHTPDEARKQQLLNWLNQFANMRAAIEISLRLIRGSTGFTSATADAGFFQQNLDSGQSNQLIRVQVMNDTAYYPEISGGKHRFTVRLMHFDINQRARQVTENVDFSLSICAM